MASLRSLPSHRLFSEAHAVPDEIFVPPAAPMTSRTSPSESTNIAGHIEDKGRLPVEYKREMNSFTYLQLIRPFLKEFPLKG